MIDFLKKNNYNLIKNIRKWRFETDFKINTIGIIIFFISSAIAVILYSHLFGSPSHKQLQMMIIPIIIMPAIIMIVPRWETIIKAGFFIILLGYFFGGIRSFVFTLVLFSGGFMASTIQIMKEWQRAVILRLGKFNKIKGPGIFILLPFIDTVSEVVDLRIRVSDFAAETTLTNDSVTVTVDALCFWMVWDAEKAILEVENYIEAVILSSQTALRSAISKHSLLEILSDGEKIEERIRSEVDKKTTEWGITVQHIEITEIKIPEQLQLELSKGAIAEREKKARILMGEAELEISELYTKAAEIYKSNKDGIKLRSMNIINEGLKEGNSMIVTPTGMQDIVNDDIIGIAALDELKKIKKNINYKGDKNVNS